MKSWSLIGVEREKRKDFIIECLQDYIDEVDKMDIRDSPYLENIEICDVADLYNAIIEELTTENKYVG